MWYFAGCLPILCAKVPKLYSGLLPFFNLSWIQLHPHEEQPFAERIEKLDITFARNWPFSKLTILFSKLWYLFVKILGCNRWYAGLLICSQTKNPWEGNWSRSTNQWFTSIFPSSLWPEYLNWVPIESLGCKEMTSACVMFFHVMYCVYPRFLGFLKNQQVNEALWEVQCRMEHLAPWCPAMLTTILLSLIIIHQSELWIYFWTSNYMAPHFFSLETSSMTFVGTQSSMRIEPILGIHTVDGSTRNPARRTHQLRLVVYRLPVYPPLFRTGLIHLRWCKISEPSTVPCLASIHSQLGWSF